MLWAMVKVVRWTWEMLRFLKDCLIEKGWKMVNYRGELRWKLEYDLGPAAEK